ncbi:MAG: agarase, partial [Clostridia bacterium]|nr:agarase [Clostridia bacterium]
MDVWEADNRMTNQSGAGFTVRTQDDRGKFYQNYALMLMECMGCVGFDWFHYCDNDPDNLNADASNINSNKVIYSN